MSRVSDDRIRKQLDEAEGYLMLDLPGRSLQILESRPDWLNMQFEASLLKGEALRSLKHYREALRPLEIAAGLRPTDTRVALALGGATNGPIAWPRRSTRSNEPCESIPTTPSYTIIWRATGAWPAIAPRRSTNSRSHSSSMPTFGRLSPTKPISALRGNPAFERLLGHAPQTVTANRRAMLAANHERARSLPSPTTARPAGR